MKTQINGIEAAYDIHGVSGSWVMLSHSLGCSKEMWRGQVNELSKHYRVLSYDLRGHGGSSASAEPGSLDLLALDALALLDSLNIDSVHFVGISIGGMIGQRIALNTSERIDSLVLSNTSFKTAPETKEGWSQRISQARNYGLKSLAKATMERWFPAEFRSSRPEVIEGLEKQFAATSLNGYVACCEAIMGHDLEGRLPTLKKPVLIIAGSEDQGVSLQATKTMHELLPSSKLAVLAGAGHLSNIDRSDQFNAELSNFMESVVLQKTHITSVRK